MVWFVMLVILDCDLMDLHFISNIRAIVATTSKTNNPNCYRDRIFAEIKPRTIYYYKKKRQRERDENFCLEALNDATTSMAFKLNSVRIVYLWRRLVASIMMIYSKYTNQNFVECVCMCILYGDDMRLFSDRFSFCLLCQWMVTQIKHTYMWTYQFFSLDRCLYCKY